MHRVLKKTLICFICFFYCFPPIQAKEKYVIFLEASNYTELVKYKSIRYMVDNSITGLCIQRNNGEEFGFFRSIKDGKPSYIKDSDVPLYKGNFIKGNVDINGYVEKDGKFYMPSLILFNGQTLFNENQRLHIMHTKKPGDIDKTIKSLLYKENTEIIICTWVKNSEKQLSSYLMPFIYYDGKRKGVFYSNTTRNKGILDFQNLNEIILRSDFKNITVVKDDIKSIYNKRINSFRNKRIFLTLYGYLMGASVITNCMLLKFNGRRFIKWLSGAVIVMPLIILIQPIINIENVWFTALFIAAFSFAVSMILNKNIKYIFLLFFITLYFDAISKSFLLKNSLLSYEPALGARFYGIGNEYLGIILAYTFALVSETKYKYSPYFWLLNSLLLLMDRCGSNFGGFLTCSIMAVLTSSLKFVIILFGLAILLVSTSQNHIKTFFIKVFSGRFIYVLEIIRSKLSTLGKLLSFSIWVKLSAVSILVYVYETLKGKFKYGSNKTQFMICCILVTLFNDSGIVSMALMLGIYINYLFYKTVF